MNTIEVEVTQKDIDIGKHGSQEYCPVALAIRRAFQSEVVQISGHAGWIDDVPIQLSDNVRSFVVAFDAGRYVSPFTFTLWRIEGWDGRCSTIERCKGE